MVHVSSTMWRIKNQSSNSTSCSDNALRWLVFMAGRLYWGLQVTSSFSIWGCDLKGCFERRIFWRAKPHLKGIEDFNLEHCPPHPSICCTVKERREKEIIKWFNMSVTLEVQLWVDSISYSCNLSLWLALVIPRNLSLEWKIFHLQGRKT